MKASSHYFSRQSLSIFYGIFERIDKFFYYFCKTKFMFSDQYFTML